MTRIQMISGGNLDQLVPAGKPMRQKAEKVEPAQDKCARDEDHRTAENNQDNHNVKSWVVQRVVIEPCAGLPREPSIAHEDQHARDDDQRDESNQSIKENSEKSSGLLIRSLLPEQISLDNIAAG